MRKSHVALCMHLNNFMTILTSGKISSVINMSLKYQILMISSRLGDNENVYILYVCNIKYNF